MNRQILKGSTFPIGSSVMADGVNFSIFSKNSTAVELLLFNDPDDAQPNETITLDKEINRTESYWHVFVPGLKAGQIYAYRMYGPFNPERGYRFDSQKVLLDPYGKLVIIPKAYKREYATRPGNNVSSALKNVVVDTGTYDWEDDVFPRHSFTHTIIYELHVKGFTQHPNSGIVGEKRGTYAGLIEKIPYLKDLGITALEFLPVFQFDDQDAPLGKKNYWGYSPVSFFAPHRAYSSRKDIMGPLDEFRDMVKALHKAGIEVILDVVYNHTAEGGQEGPTLCFKGIENKAYYILGSEGAYKDYSGCGNTINANHSIARRMILDSLRFWVSEMHVDGFRFDLASVLSRDEFGNPQQNPPILWEIQSDPILAGTKLIAEAWDAAGLYQVGSFVGDKWKEWNGKFRDDVRSFIRGDQGTISNFASRILASPDLFGQRNLPADTSINFITCHDGFTLNDLVSYNEKHNWENGEGNRDGTDHNLSYNFGVEGPSDDPIIERQREQQIKNYLAVTLLSYGTPMILMGDELRRTQKGNNNAYCQDNEISWFDWDLLKKNESLYRFVKVLNGFRLNTELSVDDRTLSLMEFLRTKRRINWSGVRLGQPDWSFTSHSLAGTVWSDKKDTVLFLVCNAHTEELDFEIPDTNDFNQMNWFRIIDTSLPSPNDIVRLENAEIVEGDTYPVKARSVVFLIAPSDSWLTDFYARI
ncbi:glycogen debranching protein GlgX [Maribacter polysaccharolyticus]|uniref:glycogen debranching protein GlgX n=1 Tax=Maribacter polysaccharolyticus TaxID=3020831 RepID=UPI00237EF697|nr:glycogen debranching protein GlgX [Maribacter polysaccharolyticus]MDE3740865.1 glycogen debranching protein GlgX [Maribacter polysaccharolyticus]